MIFLCVDSSRCRMDSINLITIDKPPAKCKIWIENDLNGFFSGIQISVSSELLPFSKLKNYERWLKFVFVHRKQMFLVMLEESIELISSFLKIQQNDPSVEYHFYFHYWNCIRLGYKRYGVDVRIINSDTVMINESRKGYFHLDGASEHSHFKNIPSFEKIAKHFLTSRKINANIENNGILMLPAKMKTDFCVNLMSFLHNFCNYERAVEFAKKNPKISDIEVSLENMSLGFSFSGYRLLHSMLGGKWNFGFKKLEGALSEEEVEIFRDYVQKQVNFHFSF